MTEVEWIDTFRGNLQGLMEEGDWTRKELAEDSGISEASLCRYLSDSKEYMHMPSLKHILALSYSLSCDVADLCDFGDKID